MQDNLTSSKKMKDKIIAQFKTVYGFAPDVIARAPGRLEFIGNHTDYNGGTVLGAAIDRGIWVAVRAVPGITGVKLELTTKGAHEAVLKWNGSSVPLSRSGQDKFTTPDVIRSEKTCECEIDLRGEALAIGGLKEKSLAALRVGIKDIIIPFANQKDLEEIAPEVRAKLTFHPVKHVEEVFEIALTKWINPEKKAAKKAAVKISAPRAKNKQWLI